jgi:hypothetical protein
MQIEQRHLQHSMGACGPLPLPHPSGVSRWLNEPAHQKLRQKALEILAEWRVTYAL